MQEEESGVGISKREGEIELGLIRKSKEISKGFVIRGN
jgi:hypothetical protein